MVDGFYSDGDIEYGDSIWLDLLSSPVAMKSKTSFSYSKGWYDDKIKYNRAKTRYEKKRKLWEAGIIERIGYR